MRGAGRVGGPLPTRSLVAGAAVSACVVVASAGCAGGSPGDLTAAASKVLKQEVQHVREVAATGDYAGLTAAVGSLKTLVQQERDAGQVSDSRATAIMDAADTLLQDASPSPSPSLSSSSSSSSPSQSPTPSSSSPSPTPTPTSSAPSPTATSSSPTQSASPSRSSRSITVSVGPSVP